jgi:hypothetical protein
MFFVRPLVHAPPDFLQPIGLILRNEDVEKE